ncbi:MAG TPA: hypothetical protein V6C99_07455 [Oculatellaceae cyanobacterium]|jgi:hypothetical protein
MSNVFQLQSTDVTGADFLRFLLTPECIHPDHPPTEASLRELDFSRYGKTESEIRQFFEQKAREKSAFISLTGYFHVDLLNQAMNQGLIYRLINPAEGGKAYYGVPENVRRELALEWTPDKETKSPEPAPMDTHRLAFVVLLKRFLQQLSTDSSAELREYGAQLALNALEQNDLNQADIPASLWETGQTLGLMAVPHYAVLTVLLEACVGTPFFRQARELCDAAVDAQLLSADDMASIINQPITANPFRVLTSV